MLTISGVIMLSIEFYAAITVLSEFLTTDKVFYSQI